MCNDFLFRNMRVVGVGGGGWKGGWLGGGGGVITGQLKMCSVISMYRYSSDIWSFDIFKRTSE